jgi:hypothetical protein
MQANVHEMRVLLAQQQFGYTQMLALQSQLRDLEAGEEGEEEVAEESDE